ncbi:MAG: beta-ketoacyl synthase chain length factor [Myxococcota bacterium]
MTDAIEAAVLGTGLFAPAIGEGPADGPRGELIEKRARRRCSVLTKALADVYGDALATSGLNGAEVDSVFGSALGEASTMIGLLDQMWREGGPLSPMRFAMSVHNAAAGVVSISTENRGFTTSLGADFDTPAMALVEAMGLVAVRHDPVVVACGDEAAPADLVEEVEWELLAAAVALGPVDVAPPGAPRIRGPLRPDPSLTVVPAGDAVERNPQAGLLDLVRAVRAGAPAMVRLDRGQGGGFYVEVRPGAP